MHDLQGVTGDQLFNTKATQQNNTETVNSGRLLKKTKPVVVRIHVTFLHQWFQDKTIIWGKGGVIDIKCHGMAQDMKNSYN